jgi:hypothetical protein
MSPIFQNFIMKYVTHLKKNIGQYDTHFYLIVKYDS